MNLLQGIFRPRVSYKPLIEVRVFKDAILHNLKIFQKSFPKFQFAPVLKSNAYGHGLVEVAGILDNQGCSFFMVDSFYEALVLRRAFIKTKVLILGFVREEEILKNQLENISYGIIDLEVLKNLSARAAKPINIHLKIDTGMHRQGILSGQVKEALRLIRANKHLKLEGVCSHLADADGDSNEFTIKQIKIWNEVAGIFKIEFPETKYFHLPNTAGASLEKEIDANVSRLGIGLYGFSPSVSSRPSASRKGTWSPRDFTSESRDPDQRITLDSRFCGNDTKGELLPALEMRSIITSLKTIPAGDKVGYNITYTAPKTITVATVPAGYNEGVDRRLSNKGFYKVKNIFCPVVGRVSMNMSSVDVSAVPGLKLEDEVIIISANKNDKNSVENIAKLSCQITHEILVKIPQYLKRVVI